ncbi:MAG: selenocysteine-specific translation elongation factor [Firmicutes bacterium]|nr:selenocysteine-specific translation elongation factor [Bacillota bacterium]
MKNIIIGTAGHIDHGKTTLIKALTGRETDRLKEEKNRGISIELGFTYFDLPSGRRAGIIDVPGHEKFIKNMLAGVIGMDLVILVVAADEGVMPQTKEHLSILKYLNIKKGITVITKADMVDEEWLELVKDDLEEYLQDTFLKDSPIFTVSSTKKTGIKEVIKTIDELTEDLEDRDEKEMPRIPIDRVFSITGIGTIITGTLVSGRLENGEDVQVYPKDKTARIRSIQVHGEDSEKAYAGQRVALNLAGIKKDEINRGDIIAPKDSMKSTMMIDVKLNLLKSSQRIIENRTRVRLYLGTKEILCRVVLLDKEFLTPGESCYAQLRLEEETVARRGDRFIIRFYSPMITIGGGEVLEANPPKRKRFEDEVIEELKVKETGDTIDVLEKIIKDKSESFPSVKELIVATALQKENVLNMINKLKSNKRIIDFNLLKDKHVIHIDYYNKVKQKIIKELTEYHRKNPLKLGILKEELRSKYFNKVKPKLGESYIEKLIYENIIKQENENISLKDFKVELNQQQINIRNEIEKLYLKDKFSPIKKEDIFNALDYSDEEIEMVYNAMLNEKILIKISNDIIFHNKAYEEAKKKVKKFITEKGSITLAEYRDQLNTSRKYAIALLEYFDQNKITNRQGDKRTLQ